MYSKRVRLVQYIAALVGLSDSLYLTAVHYAGIPLVCSDSGIINCASLLNSNFALLLGIPLAVYGIVFFAVELLALRIGNKDGIMIWNIIGVGAVMYFLFLEYTVGHICAWCTLSHVMVGILFAGSIYEAV